MPLSTLIIDEGGMRSVVDALSKRHAFWLDRNAIFCRTENPGPTFRTVGCHERALKILKNIITCH